MYELGGGGARRKGAQLSNLFPSSMQVLESTFWGLWSHRSCRSHQFEVHHGPAWVLWCGLGVKVLAALVLGSQVRVGFTNNLQHGRFCKPGYKGGQTTVALCFNTIGSAVSALEVLVLVLNVCFERSK